MNRVALALVVLVSAVALAGCGPFERARLFADSYTDKLDGFSDHSPQWAADGETVTFDFAPDSSADYAVFTWPDGKQTFIDRTEKKNAFFRTTHVFAAGPEPRSYEVAAAAYMIRGECDWYLDSMTHEWAHHKSIHDDEDENIGRAKMEIVCYRPEVDFTFVPVAGKTVKELVLTFFKSDAINSADRIERFHFDLHSPDHPGFTLIGPDQRGQYHLHYEPKAEVINRTGETAVELLITYNDGTQELVKQRIKTP